MVNNKAVEIVNINTKVNQKNNYLNQNSPVNLSNNLHRDIIDLKTVNSAINIVMNLCNKTNANISLAKAKVVAGLYDGLEMLGDGELRIINRIFEGQTYALANIIRFINPNASNAIMDFRKNVSDWIKEDIAVDIVNSFEDEFYNSKYGSNINNNSFIKNDSVVANEIENKSRVIGEIALATAATVGTAGIATVALTGGLGYASGSGEKANTIYRENINTTGAQEAEMFFSGLAGAAKWYAEGIVGSKLLQMFSRLGEIISIGPKPGQLGKAIWEVLTIKKPKKVDKYVKAAKMSPREIANLIDVIGSSANTISDSMDSGDSLAKTSAKVVSGVACNVVLNSAFDVVGFRARQMRGNPLSGQVVYSVGGNVSSIAGRLVEFADGMLDSGFVETKRIDKLVDDIAESVDNLSTNMVGKE